MKIIIYDFDGTLTPSSVPRYKVLDKEIDVIGLLKDNFTKSNNIYDLFYNFYFNEFKKLNCKITDEILCSGSKDITYSDGVVSYLEEISNKGVKNYLLSSGLKIYLENTIIAKYFEKIYGTTLKYHNNEVIGLDYMMTDKDKVKTIKQIVQDNSLSDCKDIIYIGDGLTDMEAFKYIYDNGGISIFVYGNKEKIIKQPFISYYLKRDYTKDSEFRKLIESIID